MTRRRGAAGTAIVVGAGHNGLVAANMLADAGWRVVVLEANREPVARCYSDQSMLDGFVTDWFSAFYPFGAASPVLPRLELERWGLSWQHAPAVLAHLFPDGRRRAAEPQPGRDRRVTGQVRQLATGTPGSG